MKASTLKAPGTQVRKVELEDIPLFAGADYLYDAYRDALRGYGDERKAIIKRRYRKGRIRKTLALK